MRSAVLTKFGGPDSFEFRDFERPTPGPGEALIRVKTVGVCGRDVLVRKGEIPGTRLPTVLGHEIAGFVDEVGDGVEGIGPGDRVATRQKTSCHMCRLCRTGAETLCRDGKQIGDDLPGGCAEYLVLDYLSLVRVPENVAMEHAAIAACAIGSDLHAIRLVNLRAGERVLVTGAGGGLGIHALQLARAAGAEVVAVTSSEARAVALTDYADHVIISEGGRFDQEVRAKRIVPDVILEMTAGVTLTESLRAVARGGRIVVVGNVNLEPVRISTGALINRETKLMGSTSTSREELEDTLSLISRGVIKPIVGAKLQLAEIAEAHRVVESREVLGRVVMDCY